MVKKVVIVGAGMMGSGIASIAALAGKEVVLVDFDYEHAENGKRKSSTCIRELQENGLASDDNDALQHITCSGDLQTAIKDADMVIEAIYENLTAKQDMFEKLDRLLPANIPILSNTSGLRITDIAVKAVCHPERTMTAHFWLPAHLIPLVEVVLWEKTDRELAIKVRDELKSWDKQPVLVNKDLPGQLANRILQAIIREAANIVDIGLASAEDVDTAVKAGMGLRFPAWGPLEHVDAVGLDLCLSVQQNVLPEISNRTENDAMKSLVEKGDMGYKSKRGFYNCNEKDMNALVKKRNEFIIAARRHLKSVDL